MKDYLLFLNTVDSRQIRLALVGESRVFVKNFFARRGLSEQLLFEITKLLARHRISWVNLKKIAAVIGPGSFSSLRTGLITANSLAFVLKIPIVGLRTERAPREMLGLWKTPATAKSLLPFYGRPPHITRSKPR